MKNLLRLSLFALAFATTGLFAQTPSTPPPGNPSQPTKVEKKTSKKGHKKGGKKKKKHGKKHAKKS